ncbi:hypothetical protein S83_001100 [Arachis hypogaea]
MARDILGPPWGRFLVGPIQFTLCFCVVVACILLGGKCMKIIYLLSNPNGSMKLYEFIVEFGLSLILCLAYSACAIAGSIYIGYSSKGPKKDYSIKGNTESRIFGAFNAMSIIATAYGNGIVPEIQATLAPPVKGKMFKGLCICYAVIIVTFFGAAISGYWAFGNQAEGLILTNFTDSNGK